MVPVMTTDSGRGNNSVILPSQGRGVNINIGQFLITLGRPVSYIIWSMLIIDRLIDCSNINQEFYSLTRPIGHLRDT